MYVSTDQVTIAWDPSQGATRYEVQTLWLDPSNGPIVFNVGQTSDTQMVITKPRTGHFAVRVRACNDSGCSDWSESTDETKVKDGVPFRIYFKPAPAGRITVE